MQIHPYHIVCVLAIADVPTEGVALGQHLVVPLIEVLGYLAARNITCALCGTYSFYYLQNEPF
jgi:hypothetical protein